MKRIALALILVAALGTTSYAGDPVERRPVHEAIKDLGDDNYDVREYATTELLERATVDKTIAEAVLKVMNNTKDAEVHARCQFILARLGKSENPKPKVDRGRPPAPRLPRVPDIPDMRGVPKGPLALPKDFDFKKIFGVKGFDVREMMKAMGVPPEMAKILESFLRDDGSNPDYKKFLDQLMRGPQVKPEVEGEIKPDSESDKGDKKVPPEWRQRANTDRKTAEGLVWRRPSPALRQHLGIKDFEGGALVVKPVGRLKEHDIVIAVDQKLTTDAEVLNKVTDSELEIVRSGRRFILEKTGVERDIKPPKKDKNQ